MHEAQIAVAQHVGGPLANRRDDGVAHVPAPILAEHEHQVGRRRDDAPEVRRTATRGGDEREGQKERDGEARDGQGDLDDDQAPDAPVRVGRDRPRGVQRHVGCEVGQDPKPGDRVGRLDVLVSGLADGHRPPGEERAPGRRQVADEAPLLLELSSHDRVGGA